MGYIKIEFNQNKDIGSARWRVPQLNFTLDEVVIVIMNGKHRSLRWEDVHRRRLELRKGSFGRLNAKSLTCDESQTLRDIAAGIVAGAIIEDKDGYLVVNQRALNLRPEDIRTIDGFMFQQVD